MLPACIVLHCSKVGILQTDSISETLLGTVHGRSSGAQGVHANWPRGSPAGASKVYPQEALISQGLGGCACTHLILCLSLSLVFPKSSVSIRGECEHELGFAVSCSLREARLHVPGCARGKTERVLSTGTYTNTHTRSQPQ